MGQPAATPGIRAYTRRRGPIPHGHIRCLACHKAKPASDFSSKWQQKMLHGTLSHDSAAFCEPCRGSVSAQRLSRLGRVNKKRVRQRSVLCVLPAPPASMTSLEVADAVKKAAPKLPRADSDRAYTTLKNVTAQLYECQRQGKVAVYRAAAANDDSSAAAADGPPTPLDLPLFDSDPSLTTHCERNKKRQEYVEALPGCSPRWSPQRCNGRHNNASGDVTSQGYHPSAVRWSLSAAWLEQHEAARAKAATKSRKRKRTIRQRVEKKRARQERRRERRLAKRTAEPPVAATEEDFVETHYTAAGLTAEAVDTDTISITQTPSDPAGDGRQ